MTTTTNGQRVEPPPDPLWFPDAAWPGPRSPVEPWMDDGGGPAGGDVDSIWAALPAASHDEGPAPTGPALASPGGDDGFVFCATPSSGGDFRQSSAAGLPPGFSGSLRLRSVDSLDQNLAGSGLQGLRALLCWAAAAQARLVHRQHSLMIRELEQLNREHAARDAACGRPAAPRSLDRALAFSLAVTEIATMLGIPEGTASALVDESDELCERCPTTLTLLERGEISPAQTRTIVDQTRSLVTEEIPPGACPDVDTGQGLTTMKEGAVPPGAAHAMEQELLKLAPGLTNAQFIRKARRLRERSYPKTIPVRHRTAFEQRRVWFQPQADGMGQLTAYLPADKGQTIFGALTGAARGEQSLGDPRGLDQLRTDILASLLLHTPEPWVGGPESGNATASSPAGGPRLGSAENLSNTETDSASNTESGLGFGLNVPPLPSGSVAEIMVLISADTLFGADDAPAELTGYGPISAQDARRLARTACRWTGLVQDPQTGQILGVGRRRKVPAGLRRWLQARDQTCRFPGCSAGTARTEADHTIPWAQGGPTEHWNLANLCKKHHRMKTLGYWKARQVSAGVLEWISPLGRHYQTQPELVLRQLRHPRITESEGTPDPRQDPPPF